MSKTPIDPLAAISPLDGRYRRQTEDLVPLASEWALIRYRVKIEIEWFVHLAQNLPQSILPSLDAAMESKLQEIYLDFSIEDGHVVKNHERKTNHDVKAVEYFVKERLAEFGLNNVLEFVHFGCTSEDINNISYALMLSEIRDEILNPTYDSLILQLAELASQLINVPIVARTHGQIASPSTMGKELAVFIARFESCQRQLKDIEILAKMNGAVGNFNAHVAALPEVDWVSISDSFIDRLQLVPNRITTQIEPHDYMASFCRAIVGFNQVLLDFDRDIWAYISLGYFKQKQVAGEVGSSTMPHKVNPIDFENSEGNIGVSNALLNHLAEKLPISRWQRDLSDSTVQRNFGSAIGYALASYRSAARGIAKLSIDKERVHRDLNDAWEVLAEAVQTAMRVANIDQPYERVKELTRGAQLNQERYHNLLDVLALPSGMDAQLRKLTPDQYIGLASQLATETIERARRDRS